MVKTALYAFITQHMGNRNDKICRRIWEDENGEWFVKVNFEWVRLRHYQRNKHYEVKIG